MSDFYVDISCIGTAESRYNEVPRHWQNFFAITRLRYIEVLFHLFCYFWGRQNCSALYRGFCYIEVCYIEVPLYVFHACTQITIYTCKINLGLFAEVQG